jgi:CheY-like chemotaxis protein
VIYTARDLTKKEELKLGRATKTIVVKEVRSPERLKDEVTAILEETSGAPSPQSGSNGYEPNDSLLAGKKVLVVDDDIRNIFALTAMLERHEMEVISVDSGQEALDTLGARGDIDLALVDVMMPEMDGYQTMSKMRELASFRERPIIALTAKAMMGDREKCIDAGASDYIAKPVNTTELMSMLKSWLTP